MPTKKPKLSTSGLEKLFGNNVDNLITEIEHNTEKLAKDYLDKININDIKPNPYQPRKTFDPKKLEELSESIKENGVIQPILLRQNKLDNTYYLIAGERRLKASKLANLKEIPAIVLDISDEKMHEYALIENIQRVNLNPIEEAVSFAKLIKLFKINQEKLAEKLGKSSPYISNSLRLLNLPKKVQQLLIEQKITIGHAKPLLGILNNDDLVEKIANTIILENWNVRKVEKYVSMLNNKEEKSSKVNKFENQNDEINKFLENKLIELFGTKVSLTNNKIVISYHDVNDLNRILKIIKIEDEI